MSKGKKFYISELYLQNYEASYQCYTSWNEYQNGVSKILIRVLVFPKTIVLLFVAAWILSLKLLVVQNLALLFKVRKSSGLKGNECCFEIRFLVFLVQHYKKECVN